MASDAVVVGGEDVREFEQRGGAEEAGRETGESKEANGDHGMKNLDAPRHSKRGLN